MTEHQMKRSGGIGVGLPEKRVSFGHGMHMKQSFAVDQQQHAQQTQEDYDNEDASSYAGSVTGSIGNLLSNSRLDPYDLYSYFMNIAVLASKKRKNKKNQSGAIIVNTKKEVVSIGYNTMKTDMLSFIGKTQKNTLHSAVSNAIMNKKEASLEGYTVYTTCFPGVDCAKMIVNAGLVHVVFARENSEIHRQEVESVRVLFRLANIQLTNLDN